METSIDTDNDHMNLYDDIKSFGMCYILQSIYYSGCAALIVLIMEEEEVMVGRPFNSFKELQSSAYVGCTKSIKLHSYINS